MSDPNNATPIPNKEEAGARAEAVLHFVQTHPEATLDEIVAFTKAWAPVATSTAPGGAALSL